MKQLLVIACAALAAIVAACGGGSSGGSMSPPSGGGGGGGGSPPPVSSMTIGFALPNGTIGTINTPFGIIGGYTQQTYSQVIAFPPGTTVTLKNLSSNTPHTLNVLSTSAFPANPTLDTTASGGDTLASGYRSGAIASGATMSLKLANAGTYFVGCAFHYALSPSMRGVIEVSSSATPGPQATAPPNNNGGNGGGY